MKINRKIGNDFETVFCEILSDCGFWVHNFALKKSGQPADVIAVKNGSAILIDCKVCENDNFQLSRIEENQKLSMDLWLKCCNGQGWFALKTSKGIYMITLSDLLDLSKFKTSLNLTDIIENSVSLEKWL